MKKRLIGVFLAAVMTAAAIAGCGGSTAAPAAEKEEETEAVSQAEEESAEEMRRIPMSVSSSMRTPPANSLHRSKRDIPATFSSRLRRSR